MQMLAIPMVNSLSLIQYDMFSNSNPIEVQNRIQEKSTGCLRIVLFNNTIRCLGWRWFSRPYIYSCFLLHCCTSPTMESLHNYTEIRKNGDKGVGQALSIRKMIYQIRSLLDQSDYPASLGSSLNLQVLYTNYQTYQAYPRMGNSLADQVFGI